MQIVEHSKRLSLRAVVIMAAILSGRPSVAATDVTYRYTGGTFTRFAGSYACPPVCRITGSITLTEALPANFGIPEPGLGLIPATFSPKSYRFTDGLRTFSSESPHPRTGFFAVTDASGRIEKWLINLYGPDGELTINNHNTGHFDGAFDTFFSYAIGPVGEWVAQAPLAMAIDANRDGTVSLDGTADGTTPTAPFQFWTNTDRDAAAGNLVCGDEFADLEPGIGARNGADDVINTVRDLEDFAQLAIRAPWNFDPTSPLWEVVLSASNSASFELNVFRATQAGDGYLRDRAVANAQAQEPLLVTVAQGASVDLPPSLFLSENKTAYLLFEGVFPGEGVLTVRFLQSGALVGEAHVYLSIRDMTALYDVWSVGDNPTDPVAVSPQLVQAASIPPGQFADYFLFVHGWRMRAWEKRAFAETAFKELWHQGYRGGFGVFTWPALHTFTPCEGLGYFGNPINRYDYERTEEKAWRSAEGLMTLLQGLLPGPQRVHVLAHSMGNVVVGEALKRAADLGLGQLLRGTYIATQAAVPASAYNYVLQDLQLQHFPQAYPAPDPYAGFPETTSRRPYFWNISRAAPRMVNFFNPRDFALDLWQDMNEYKPEGSVSDVVGPVHYGWIPTSVPLGGFFYRVDSLGTPTMLRFSDTQERFEIFSYAARARSLPVGQQPGIAGPFGGQLNLDTTFGFGTTHSAQFLASIQKRGPYWKTVLDYLNLSVLVPLGTEPDASILPGPVCATPDPFTGTGGGTCFNGGWLPPGFWPPVPRPTASTQTTPAPPSAGGGSCVGSDPFAGMGGGTCFNGGWLPPGIQPPAGAQPAPTPAPTLMPPPAPEGGSCAGPDPFAAMGGGTCHNGGWWAPGMVPPSPPPSTPPSAPTPPAADVGGSICATPDPFVAIGGGTCNAGGWLAPGMVTPSRPPTALTPPAPPAANGTCATPDPFVGIPGLVGLCVNAGWIPIRIGGS